MRLIRGEIKRGMRVTSSRGQAEVITKIYEPLADEYREVGSVQAGDVAICAGLKVNTYQTLFVIYNEVSPL